MQLKVENEESKEKVGLYSSCLVPFLDLREVLRSQDFFFFSFFLKRGWAWLVHGRIAYECFAYLWGTAVLWEDASGINMCNQG